MRFAQFGGGGDHLVVVTDGCGSDRLSAGIVEQSEIVGAEFEAEFGGAASQRRQPAMRVLD